MYTGKKINKPGEHTIYVIISFVLLPVLAWSCKENKFLPAPGEALDGYTVKISQSELPAGELQNIFSLHAYIVKNGIIRAIEPRTRVREGTIRIHAEEGDSVYFMSDIYSGEEYDRDMSRLRIYISDSIDTFLKKVYADDEPRLFYSGGPFVIGSSEKLELKRSTARIDLEIQENNSDIRVTQIDFLSVERVTTLFPDLYFAYDSDYYNGYYSPFNISLYYTENPLSAGTVENIQLLYRYAGSPKKKAIIHALYGDMEEEMLITVELPDILNNHIYKLLVKDLGTNASSTFEEINGTWKEGETVNAVNNPPIWLNCPLGESKVAIAGDTLKVAGASGRFQVAAMLLNGEYLNYSILEHSPKLEFTLPADVHEPTLIAIGFEGMDESEVASFKLHVNYNEGLPPVEKLFYVKREDASLQEQYQMDDKGNMSK